MKRSKILAAFLMACIMTIMSVMPAFAATDVTIEIKATDVETGYIQDSDGDGDITDEDGNETFAVIVPSTLPIVFNEDGTNSYPSNFAVHNNSIAGVHLTNVSMTGKNDWELLKESYDSTKLPVNTTAIEFALGAEGNLKYVEPSADFDDQGSAAFDADDFQVASGESKVMSFNVNRGAFTETTASGSAYDMVLTFAFD